MTPKIRMRQTLQKQKGILLYRKEKINITAKRKTKYHKEIITLNWNKSLLRQYGGIKVYYKMGIQK